MKARIRFNWRQLSRSGAMLVALGATTACDGPASIHAPSMPHHSAAAAAVEITFAKQLDAASSQFDADGQPLLLVWRGTVDGDPESVLTSRIDFTAPRTRSAGHTLHVTVHFEVIAGERSFTATTRGMVNVDTGLVRTNGIVENGWAEGARVHQEGQMDEALGATGLIRVQVGSDS